eukprot:s8173_g5.t1
MGFTVSRNLPISDFLEEPFLSRLGSAGFEDGAHRSVAVASRPFSNRPLSAGIWNGQARSCRSGYAASSLQLPAWFPSISAEPVPCGLCIACSGTRETGFAAVFAQSCLT